MLPYQRAKVDLSKLTPEERAQALYGGGKKGFPKFPFASKKPLAAERKFFDSGDYALSKAGRAPQSIVGTAIPNPENIPHASNLGNGHNNGHQIISISPTNSTSPVTKESGLANDENTKVPEDDQLPGSGKDTDETTGHSSPAKLPGSGEDTETAEDETRGHSSLANAEVPEDDQSEEDTETTKDETTGQALAR